MRRMSSLRPQISWITTTPGNDPGVASTSRGRATAAASDPPAGSEMRTSSVPKAAMDARYRRGPGRRQWRHDRKHGPVTTVELVLDAVAAGGDAIGRDADGRVVFVEGGLPGERVRAEITNERKDYLRSRAVDVLVPSDERVAPPCPFVAAGCGGCQWQHASVGRQHGMKAAIVADALRRIAHLPDAPVGADVV